MEMNWISVDEKLPEENVEVIVLADRYCFGKLVYGGVVYVKDFGFIFCNPEDAVRGIESVTHWMPLPAAPVTE